MLPGDLGGRASCYSVWPADYLALTFVSEWLGRGRGGGHNGVLGGMALATLVAIGVGIHDLGEGLAMGSSFALGRARARQFPHRRLHDPQRRRKAQDHHADGRGSAQTFARLVALALIAGAPAIVGAWISGSFASDVLGMIFFAVAAGAALQVVVEVGHYVAGKAPGGLHSG